MQINVITYCDSNINRDHIALVLMNEIVTLGVTPDIKPVMNPVMLYILYRQPS